MARTRCDICHTWHSSNVSNQVCPAKKFEITLRFKEDHNIVGRLVISAQMEDEVVFKQMKRLYDRRVSRWKRYTRFLVLSKRLFVVSWMLGLSHMWATISIFDCGYQKSSGSDYDLVTGVRGTRSLAIIDARQRFPMDCHLYMEEEVSSSRCLYTALMFMLSAVFGPGTYVVLKPDAPSTQNWIALTALLYLVILAFLFVLGMRKL